MQQPNLLPLYELPVAPPDHHEQIRWLRKSTGTQKQCAAMAGVNVSSWQRYERGTLKPSPTVWGLFLLATDRHPVYRSPQRRRVAELNTDPGVFDM